MISPLRSSKLHHWCCCRINTRISPLGALTCVNKRFLWIFQHNIVSSSFSSRLSNLKQKLSSTFLRSPIPEPSVTVPLFFCLYIIHQYYLEVGVWFSPQKNFLTSIQEWSLAAFQHMQCGSNGAFSSFGIPSQPPLFAAVLVQAPFFQSHHSLSRKLQLYNDEKWPFLFDQYNEHQLEKISFT